MAVALMFMARFGRKMVKVVDWMLEFNVSVKSQVDVFNDHVVYGVSEYLLNRQVWVNVADQVGAVASVTHELMMVGYSLANRINLRILRILNCLLEVSLSSEWTPPQGQLKLLTSAPI